ncbi:MAG: HD-GYP domain-containing protein [Bacillota bacterium]|nr:HD-GYP domain-containing protein [Bacillota bacterium]
MRFVSIDWVKEGSYLAKTIYDNDGRVLLREGVPLNKALIRRIKLLDIHSLYITDEYSNADIEDIIKPELRQKAIKSIKDTFLSIHNYDFTTHTSTQRINMVLKERENKFGSIADVANEIIEELLSKKDVLINVVDIKSMDNYTYQHSVNVAVLSLIIGIEMKLLKTDLFALCMGALLHDTGKMMVPKDILFKYDKLTSDEFDRIKEHPKRGYDYLKTSYQVSPQARMIVLQHHEWINGKGYPCVENAGRMTKLSKIVSVADVYDALTSDRLYRRAMSPNDALEYIMAGVGTQFEYEIVEKFVKRVVPYPKGTLVKLNNGEIAVVEENIANFPLRPKIKIIKSEVPSQVNNHIELVEKLDLVINQVVYNI